MTGSAVAGAVKPGCCATVLNPLLANTTGNRLFMTHPAPRRFDLLVFDWDGTLMDSTAAIVDAICRSCADLGLAPPPESLARHVIGLGLADALRMAAPDLPPDRVPDMVERYRFHYLSRDHELTLFDGLGDMVRQLRTAGFQVAVATGKSRVGLDRALATAGLEPWFHATRCADECFPKPHPAMLMELMDQLMTEPDRTLMIGDTTHDLQMARNAGTASLAVSYGAHPLDELKSLSPLDCLETPAALREWIRNHA